MFMSKVLKVSDAFQLVDCGARSRTSSGTRSTFRGTNTHLNGSSQNNGKYEVGKTSLTSLNSVDHAASTRSAPVFFLPPHADKGYLHYVKDFTACPEDEKKRLLDERSL